MPRNLRLAILFSFLFHGALILLGRYHTSYDAYVHMFFGDHYRMDWWSLWDPRWYTGFYVSSYPPLVHQLIGLLSHLIGLDFAFALVLWITLSLLPLSVFAFTRVFAGMSVAGYASLGAAFLPSVYLTAHIFGQLPTLAATTTALFAAAAAAAYLRTGDRLSGALAVACIGTTMAIHHATLLFLPWLMFAVTLYLLLNKLAQWKMLFIRLLIFSLLSTLVILLIIWPFWEWGQTQTLQTPIDHASRHNFFKDPRAALVFFLPMYGPLMFLIPFVPAISRQRRFLGLGISFVMLFLLGLGGTTPLPRWFFGASWEWLTYDRFAFWASLLCLPFLGILVIVLRSQFSKSLARRIFPALAITGILVGMATTVLPLQPGAVEMKQIVDFLEEEKDSGWRYLTFGFGDQLARLSTLTTATTLDGSYHTARPLPELRTSGIGQIDTAFWLRNGLSALDPVLQRSGEYGVRWGFVNIPQYIPVLARNGWTKVKTLKSGIQVWENPQAKLPQASQPPSENPFASFSWGSLPILSLITSLSLGALRIWPLKAEKALRSIQAFLAGLIPISLCFWYYRTLGEFPHERVYFIYDHALIFLGDALALLVIVLWLILSLRGSAGRTGGVPSAEPRPSRGSVAVAPWRHNPLVNWEIASPAPALPGTCTRGTPALGAGARGCARGTRVGLTLIFILFLLSSFSILWSSDWRTSLSVSLHLWLVFLLILTLHNQPDVWRPAMLGFCAALSIQIIVGLTGFALQSTAFLAPLGMTWPGPIDPSLRGAVVVQLPDGLRVLRAYGTLPHPNVLGGFVLISLLGPIFFFLHKERPNNIALLLLIPGISLLVLTFSRAAWLALIVFSLVLIWKSRYFDRKRLAFLLSISALTFILTLLPYSQLAAARTVNTTSHSEEFSFIARLWLNQEAIQMIREHPLTGVGIGSFILQLAEDAGEGYVIEPVHNIFLLTGAELGIPGMLLTIALAVSFAYHLLKAQNQNAILVGATITGIGIIGLFDHYLWTLAPNRLMLGLILGLWAGQTIHHDA